MAPRQKAEKAAWIQTLLQPHTKPRSLMEGRSRGPHTGRMSVLLYRSPSLGSQGLSHHHHHPRGGNQFPDPKSNPHGKWKLQPTKGALPSLACLTSHPAKWPMLPALLPKPWVPFPRHESWKKPKLRLPEGWEQWRRAIKVVLWLLGH